MHEERAIYRSGLIPRRGLRRKLTDAQVAEMRARAEAGASSAQLAADYGVTTGYVVRLTDPHAYIRRPDAG